MDPLRPFEVLDIFGGKFKSNAPKAFKFSTKRIHSKSFPLAYKNSFRKLFLYAKGKELEWKNDKIWISQKWFEISTPNFHQLLTSIGTHFVPNLKDFGALNLDFPPKMSKASNGPSQPIFWATPSKFGENSFLSKL